MEEFDEEADRTPTKNINSARERRPLLTFMVTKVPWANKKQEKQESRTQMGVRKRSV